MVFLEQNFKISPLPATFYRAFSHVSTLNTPRIRQSRVRHKKQQTKITSGAVGSLNLTCEQGGERGKSSGTTRFRLLNPFIVSYKRRGFVVGRKEKRQLLLAQVAPVRVIRSHIPPVFPTVGAGTEGHPLPATSIAVWSVSWQWAFGVTVVRRTTIPTYVGSPRRWLGA